MPKSRNNKRRKNGGKRGGFHVRTQPHSPSGDIIREAPFVEIEPQGEAKMSEVLLDFVGPYLDNAKTDGSLEKLIKVGMLAWNTALLPEPAREEIFNKVDQQVSLTQAADLRLVVEKLVDRKLKHFAELTRAVLDYRLTMTPEGPHLSIVSTLP